MTGGVLIFDEHLVDKLPVVFHQAVDRLLDEDTGVHSAFGEDNLQHVLKNISDRTNEVYRQAHVTLILTDVAVDKFSKRAVQDPLNEGVLQVLIHEARKGG